MLTLKLTRPLSAFQLATATTFVGGHENSHQHLHTKKKLLQITWKTQLILMDDIKGRLRPERGLKHTYVYVYTFS